MKKFKFKLQKLLDIREAKEREIQNELAALISIQNLEKIKQDELRAAMEKQKDIIKGRMSGGVVSASHIMMYERFMDVSHRAIASAQDRIAGMEPEIKGVRVRLIEASKEKKVAEKLKERKWEEYQYEFNREVSKENDDINQKLYGRKLLESEAL